MKWNSHILNIFDGQFRISEKRSNAGDDLIWLWYISALAQTNSSLSLESLIWFSKTTIIIMTTPKWNAGQISNRWCSRNCNYIHFRHAQATCAYILSNLSLRLTSHARTHTLAQMDLATFRQYAYHQCVITDSWENVVRLNDRHRIAKCKLQVATATVFAYTECENNIKYLINSFFASSYITTARCVSLSSGQAGNNNRMLKRRNWGSNNNKSPQNERKRKREERGECDEKKNSWKRNKYELSTRANEKISRKCTRPHEEIMNKNVCEFVGARNQRTQTEWEWNTVQ